MCRLRRSIRAENPVFTHNLRQQAYSIPGRHKKPWPQEFANVPRAHPAAGCSPFSGGRRLSVAPGEQQPQTAPTRDVDITYHITRPGQPIIVERRRWLASQHLRRVDGSDKSATIFDQSSGELTLLNAANHTYRTLEGPVAKRMSPQEGMTLKRGGESKIAGLTCVDWSWTDDTEMHTACLTPDGVLLRLIVDGQIVA
jgi:hypothetical protein